MSNDNKIMFEPKSDKDLRANIMSYYNEIVFKNSFSFNIYIKLKEGQWISANGLNFILIFIEAILSLRPETEIYVDLFDHEKVKLLLDSEKREIDYYINGEQIPSNIIEDMTNKLLFYDSMNFSKLLFEYGINVTPSPISYDQLREKLGLQVFSEKLLFSKRMLGLNKLINSELEQRSLSNRIAIMANILYNSLFRRITPEQAKRDSEQIMFELVKNIYQHAPEDPNKAINNSGFACAQIIRTPLLNDPKIDQSLIKDLLYIEQSKKKIWQFLSITINDFGVGLPNKLRSVLLDLIKGGSRIIGRFIVDNSFLESDDNLILLGTTTDFTTKMIENELTCPEERFLEMKLENKGYGYIFCLAFIARNFGRMQIRSGSSSMLFIAKPEARFVDFWDNTALAASTLQDEKEFDKYIEAIPRKLQPSEARFPGTQVLIEIPVEVFS